MFEKIKGIFEKKEKTEDNEKIVIESPLGSDINDNIEKIKGNLEEGEVVVLNHNGIELEVAADSDSGKLVKEYQKALGELNLENYKEEYGDEEGEEMYNRDSGKA